VQAPLTAAVALTVAVAVAGGTAPLFALEALAHLVVPAAMAAALVPALMVEIAAEVEVRQHQVAATVDVVKFAFILGDYYELRNY